MSQLARSAHTPLQSVAQATQLPVSQTWFAAHALPQDPQLALSSFKLTHAPPQTALALPQQIVVGASGLGLLSTSELLSTPASADGVQDKVETALLSIVTAPLRANARPLTFALVLSVMLVSATMLPLNAVPVPSVAELPTCQKTLQSFAPLMTMTLELLAVVSVLPI